MSANSPTHLPFDVSELREGLHRWLQTPPGSLEISAALKDCFALIESSPLASGIWNSDGLASAERIGSIAQTLFSFLKFEVVARLKPCVRPVGAIVSPFAGGVLHEHCTSFQQPSVGSRDCLFQQLNVATLNPGRTGFSQLGSDGLLFWRLWAVAIELQERSIHICCLPGARLPEIAQLPDGYPFVYCGGRSAALGNCGGLSPVGAGAIGYGS